jgi:hypothetical protein
MFRDYANFYWEELLAPCPSPKLEDHPLLTVGDCLFKIFVVTLRIGIRSFFRNPRMRRVVVTGTHLSAMENLNEAKTSRGLGRTLRRILKHQLKVV